MSPVRVAVTRLSRPALIGSTNPTPRPAKPDPLIAMKNAPLRRRSGPVEDRAYLRVSGPSGPLTGVYSEPEAMPPKATTLIVTTPGTKATLFRASGPGRRGFAVGSWKLNVSMELRFTQKTGTVSCVL